MTRTIDTVAARMIKGSKHLQDLVQKVTISEEVEKMILES
jgi:hypothetical protein